MTVQNSGTNAAVTVAAEVVSRAVGGARGTALGAIVQPVVWVATGTRPDAGDAFIYTSGVIGSIIGGLAAAPAIVTGIVKAAVDDHTQTLVDEAKRHERGEVRSGIYPVGDYPFMASGGHIQAMEIASYGGVAWEANNGVYCFIKDATGRLVCDFQPRWARTVYRPLLPLVVSGNGRVRWTSR